MKKQTSKKWMMSSLLFTLLILMANVMFANGHDRNFKIEKTAGKQIALMADYPNASDLQIKIEDAFQTTLYEKNVKNTREFSQLYDLSRLPQGYYFLELENEERITTWKIHVERKDLDIEKVEELFAPNFTQESDRVKVSLNNTSEGRAMIKIYDPRGTELYEESIDESNTVERIFDFSKVAPESYLIVTTIGEKNFRYYVNE
jgi:hypothetical protein